ncbi:TonB-dependent receptor plug domain-containing protein [Mesoterricola sediminis]|uniref:TonB-dependent receptor n=1 Tax=Mesoterricola sediminis TaxID=2927980 RepID=A0AA48KD37_9BACT|nr:TonB-dependent receptor [Mesoterricola sediminis]BDU75937.1 TonB-dependent receptor [Mesoterricola sediminis]
MRACPFILPLVASLALGAVGVDDVPATTVVVSATLAPGTLAEINREVLVLDAETIRAMPVRTLADALALAATVDLQSRVPGGLFGDLRMRGTSFAGVLVCVDGVRWNDPQTAHFNLEIPVPLELVERIEVMTGSQCTFFGADAVGGVVNIITRRPDGRASARVEGGSFGSHAASALVEGRQGPWRGRAWAGYGHSDGFAPDRDGSLVQAGLEAERELPQGRARALYAYQDSRFGAQGFYGAYPSWESTASHALLLSAVLDQGGFAEHATRVDAAWRRHDDNFVLYRDRPALYQNLHRDDTWQVKAVSVLHRGGGATFTAALEAGRDTLASARLGHHQVDRGAAGLEWLQDLGAGLTFQAGLRGDHSSAWGGVLTPTAGLAWNATRDLKLRAAWGKAFRAPSFTELYYASPAQVGNQDLRPERAESVEAGADWYGPGGTTLGLTLFHRRDRAQIDWVRATAAEPWRADNIGTVTVRGLSASAAARPWPWLRCTAGMTLLDESLPPASYASRYAPDWVRLQASLTADADLGSATRLALAWVHKRPGQGGPQPSLLALRLTRRLGPLEVQLRAENLLDRRVQEIPGVDVPGRAAYLALAWRRN